MFLSYEHHLCPPICYLRSEIKSFPQYQPLWFLPDLPVHTCPPAPTIKFPMSMHHLTQSICQLLLIPSTYRTNYQLHSSESFTLPLCLVCSACLYLFRQSACFAHFRRFLTCSSDWCGPWLFRLVWEAFFLQAVKMHTHLGADSPLSASEVYYYI